MIKRLRRFELVLTDTDGVIGDGVEFAVDETVAIAYRGVGTVFYPDGINSAQYPYGKLANHVRWIDD